MSGIDVPNAPVNQRRKGIEMSKYFGDEMVDAGDSILSGVESSDSSVCSATYREVLGEFISEMVDSRQSKQWSEETNDRYRILSQWVTHGVFPDDEKFSSIEQLAKFLSIQISLKQYHDALTKRKNGDVAAHQFVKDCERILDMHWKQPAGS